MLDDVFFSYLYCPTLKWTSWVKAMQVNMYLDLNLTRINHQNNLSENIFSLPGGVDNLLHSSTFWLRGMHEEINMNIFVEVSWQDWRTSWFGRLKNFMVYQCSTRRRLCVHSIMGMQVCLTRSGQDEHVQKLYISFIWDFRFF